ncbi:hypothetical protein FHS21_001295 [Phyllobacterium trifolii]|uniref:Peptidase S24/S26A/S26B/S26C domain-containing protein n=2 Tax=Phyllobacterium trifolii TaxID=300193 RepID=A0A839U4B8_9HYPH|nr:hypothetical protein [Phyllobacterium trifolii]
MDEFAKALGYKSASSVQRYESPTDYAGGYLKRDLVAKIVDALAGKGSPAIRKEEIWELAGPEFSTRPASRPRLVQSYDPDGPEQRDNDERMSIGSETGFNGAPEGSSPQIDITAGMGAGGLAIVNEGVPGKHGMTFSAESVKDYWKLPPAILVSLGLGARDIAIFPVQGDSMQPTLDEGDVVFIDTRHRRPSPDGLYAIIDELGGLAIKRLEVSSVPGAEETLVSVISDNPRHKTKVWKVEDLYVVGRVMRKFGTVK